MINDGIKKEGNNTESFLMIGQSNMAGRGCLEDVYPIKNPLCFILRNGRWQPMTEPINPDRSIFSGRFRSGVSLAASFADENAKKYNIATGLIPCADGGTSMSQWMPGELLFDHAVAMTKLAMRTSTLKAILWHQGESDCDCDENVICYEEKFLTMIKELKRQLGTPDVPVIIGELSHCYGTEYKCSERGGWLNEIFKKICRENEGFVLVSAEGLTMKDDELHFNSESLREFGKRYFAAYDSIAVR